MIKILFTLRLIRGNGIDLLVYFDLKLELELAETEFTTSFMVDNEIVELLISLSKIATN